MACNVVKRYPDTANVNATVTGQVTLKGLNIAGKMTEVTLNTATWTALPSTPLINRNAIRIQNQSGVEIKTNYDPLTVGYVGIKIAADGSDAYDITDNIIIYAKASAGTPKILVEELS